MQTAPSQIYARFALRINGVRLCVTAVEKTSYCILQSAVSVSFPTQPWPSNDPNAYLAPNTAREGQTWVDTRCNSLSHKKTYQVYTRKHLFFVFKIYIGNSSVSKKADFTKWTKSPVLIHFIGRGEKNVTTGQNGVTENMLHFATHV